MRALKIEHLITRRDEKSLERYLSDISKINVLTPEQEVALFERMQQGDESALNKIVEHNLRFVVSVAKQYQHVGLKLGDLINEGNIGLIKAARRFDITRGFKFISYGVWWIRQSILQAINEKGSKIRMPSNQQTTAKKIRREYNHFLQHQERPPSTAELARSLEMTEGQVTKNMAGQQHISSIDAAASDDSDTPMSSLMVDTNVAAPDYKLAVIETQKKQVKQLLHKLPEKEAMVLSLYYGIGRAHAQSLQDIGEGMAITRERVRQIKDRAIKLLRRRASDLQPAFA